MLAFLFSLILTGAHAEIPAEIAGRDLFNDKAVPVATHFSDKKALVVIFLSARCPCSHSHTGLLTKMAEKYKDMRFVAVHANGDEPASEARAYFRPLHLPFPVLQDDHARIADQFHALKTPHVFVVSPEGKILYQGGITNSARADQSDRNHLEEALDDISKGSKVRTSETRTLGCVIAREGENKNVW